MKLSLLFVAILGVAAVSAVPTGNGLSRSTRGLKEDWADFYALIPTDNIVEICVLYLADDQEVQDAVAYILSDEFGQLLLTIEAIPEYIEFLDYLEEGGLNVHYYINVIHDILGLPGWKLAAPSLSVSRLISTRITGGIAGLVADIKAILPLDDIRALYHHKLATSPEFATLVGHLGSEKAQTMYGTLKENKEYQWIRAQLVAAGLDMDAVFDWLRAFINWQ